MNQTASQHKINPQAILSAISSARGRIERAKTDEQYREAAERTIKELTNCLHGKQKMVK